MSNYNEDILSKTKQFGVLGYSISKCLNILDFNSDDAILYAKEFDKPQSEVYKAYQKGIDYADFVFDMMLFNKAKEGDLVALKEFEKRKRLKIVA